MAYSADPAKIMSYLLVFIKLFPFLVFTDQEDAVEDGDSSGGDEGKSDVRTVPTLGHQPVVLGGLYSAVQDEFLPGNFILKIPHHPHPDRFESLA